mmetsp:Transcript_41108/g.96649  ORF Transcript_41108/g.96649 Transcript_41108/m.96649 type:complete len:234 (+) Transcript_41108:240-941(+)
MIGFLVLDLRLVQSHCDASQAPPLVSLRPRPVHCAGCELQVAPAFRHVHCDLELRRPDPIILRAPKLDVLSIHHFHLPLDSAEVDAPVRPVLRHFLGVVIDKVFEGQCDLHTPPFVRRAVGIVDGALDTDCSASRGHVPSWVEDAGGVFVAAVHVGFVETESPRGGKSVNLKLLVIVVASSSVDEDLEVIVLENHLVVLCYGGPHIWFLQFCADVEEGVVPSYLGTRFKSWLR